MYIAADMTALPCSFDNQDQKYAVKLSDEVTIKDAWESIEFNKFRDSLRYSCKGCAKRELCMGGCPLVNDIVLCDNKERDFHLKGDK
jgi:radical SAM protein with 4Fe4S-binding SPASM domain